MIHRIRTQPVCLRRGADRACAALTMGVLAGVCAGASAETAPEQLIVFVQPEASPLARQFQESDRVRIAALADEMGLDFRLVDVADGAPPAITITPLIVYQDHRGRSIYQGRYRTLDRLRNFVYTSRVLPQGDELLVRENILVLPLGRGKVGMPVKITELGGTPPPDFDRDAFQMGMEAAVNAAIPGAQRTARAEFGRGDRFFYLDFYPYLSTSGTLYVRAAIYSQFHCHEPIFTTDQPLSGPWSERLTVFAEAAALLERQIIRLIATSMRGDGFDAVGTDTPVRSWEQLGLALPAAPDRTADRSRAPIELVAAWVVDGESQETRPPVQFQFPDPLQMHAGRAAKLTGHLQFNPALDVSRASGRFAVAVEDVTMGDQDLDRDVQQNMLAGPQHPTSHFTFDSVRADPGSLAIGPPISATLVGEFEMKGIRIPLEVPVTLEAFVGPDARPRVSIDGRWQIRLQDPFGLSGPDGPEPANDTLVFHCHIVLEPGGPR